MQNNTEEPTRRKQVRKACTNCRKAHACCDEQRPCLRCVNLGLSSECVDAENKKRGRKRKNSGDQSYISSLLGGPNLDFTVTTVNVRTSTGQRPHMSFKNYSTPTTPAKRVRVETDKMISSQQEEANNFTSIANYSQPHLNMDNFSVPSYQTNTNSNTTNNNLSTYNQQQPSNILQSSTTIRQHSLMDAELAQLRQENELLKQQLLNVATSASCFAKTLLGLDLASRIGALLTVEGGRIVSWNTALRMMLGYEEEDLYIIVKSIRDLIHEADLKTVLSSLIDAVMNRRETSSLGFNMKHKNGHRVPVQFTTLYSYDNKDMKPLFSISFVSFTTSEQQQDWSFTQQLQQLQLQASQQKNLLAGKDINS
jgi:PAS domain S-box-containing protein